ncbi:MULTISPECIES: adenosylcobinamide-GDP ribazoletransferase [unclassified Candidatus Frackibacter]|uniref:adenosylcobinamide-GDP ribazoletransferase n=1 Tax=unclassified Candidatus Frackibacter TaxID=2648818 RepID=UPI00079195B1|nr:MULTISPECIES: adenosylcobinamide-GDP ribazoletransferase [unclassified Candidatus Frackibacter]KXS40179.1 MAG: adenosylcobinamide-GDP ribazoletransferase [Candidatus Frackibacter sp. T328-2]SDC33677.1 cobalamin-5'-phosphate synthase [Candidatus Frackibacter sp. WG11]SEM57483.1 cobalamin-5'-phosphate synthase [Candidatus Frackibacter sp. WG12]SFL69789.1 cobalamin-5'-phosphate synthase [Candidatus Frackibacter sp. WG13]
MLKGKLFTRLIIALQFLTRIPINIKVDFTPRNMGKSMYYYPIIGTIIGLILVGLNSLFGIFWSNLVVKTLILIALIIITGGLHLDGYMDTIDGIFSGRNKKRMLEIMRDSRVGAHGVTGFFALMILKFVFLLELSGQLQLEALLLMPTFSRWAMVYAAALYPYARKDEGLGKAHAHFVGVKEVLITSLWTVILAGLLLGTNGILAFILILGITVLVIKIIIKRIDGLTGDCYGAINELIEVFSLLVLTLIY